MCGTGWSIMSNSTWTEGAIKTLKANVVGWQMDRLSNEYLTACLNIISLSRFTASGVTAARQVTSLKYFTVKNLFKRNSAWRHRNNMKFDHYVSNKREFEKPHIMTFCSETTERLDNVNKSSYMFQELHQNSCSYANSWNKMCSYGVYT